MRQMTARCGSALLAAAALALFGCGCGSSDEPSKRESYIKQADAICQEGKEPSNRLTARLTAISRESTGDDAEDFAKASAVVSDIIALVGGAQAKLARLKSPPDLAAPASKWLSLQDQMVSILRRAKTAADKQNSPRFKAEFAELNRVGLARNAAAAKVGFKVCGATPSQGQPGN